MLLLVCFHCIQVCTYEEGHRCLDSEGKEYESNSENVLLVRAEPENMSNSTREWNPHRADNETNLGFQSRKRSTGNGFSFSVVKSKPGSKVADTECQPSDNNVSAFNLKTSDSDFCQHNEMKNDRQYHFMNEDKLTENRRTGGRPSRVKHSDACEPSTRTCLSEHDAQNSVQKLNIFPPEVSRSQIQFFKEMAFQQCETDECIQNQNETSECDPSDDDTTSTGNLKDQTKVHVNTNSYDCDICYKRYSTEKLLKTHFLSHKGQKIFKCCECDYVTKFKHKIKRHRHYNCGICNKSFTVQKQLNTHYLSHEGWKTFKCDECEFVTMYKQNLKQHKKVHKKKFMHYPLS